MSRSIALNIAIIGIIYLILSYLFKRNETFTEGMAPIPKSMSLIENLSTPILSPIIFSTPVVTTGTFTVTWSGGTAPGVTTLYTIAVDQITDSLSMRDSLGNIANTGIFNVGTTGNMSFARGIKDTLATSITVTGGALWPGITLNITVTARSQVTSLYNAATTTNTIKVNPTPVNSTPPPPQNPTLVNPTPPPPPNPTLAQPQPLITGPNTTLATGNVFVLPGDNFDQTIQTNGYSGRYIRVRPPQSTGDGYLNLSQIIVKNAAGTNVALNKPVYVTTSHPSGASGSILVDGNTTKRFWPNIWHSDKGDRSDFVEIDLGSSMAISSVQIIARDEFPNRVRNIRIEINTTTNIVPTLYTTVPQPPQPPTNITATNITLTSARISWTNTNSKVQYTVSTTPSTTATPIIIGLSSVDLTGLLPNTMYYFNASSINTSGQISTAPLFNFTTLPPPPENIIATNITSNSARISWTKKTNNQVQYTISTTPSTTNTPIKIGLSYVDLIGFLPNTTYYFNISTLSTLGLISKAPLFTFTTLATPPTNITATNITLTSATISWTNTNSKVQYTVSTTPSTTTTPIIIGLSSVNLTGLLPNTTYFFKVDSINTTGQKTNIPLFIFKTLSLPPTNWGLRSINPNNISITGVTKDTCTLQWTDSPQMAPNLTGVISYYYTLSPVPSSTQPNLGTTKSVNYTKLLPNTTYTFTITSIYNIGSTPPITKTFKTLP